MDGFFSNYASFTHNPEASLINEFNRLAVSQRWRPTDRTQARERFRSAMVAEFNARYGTDEKNLTSWQNLCRVFNIQPVPSSIRKCKKVCLCLVPALGTETKVFVCLLKT